MNKLKRVIIILSPLIYVFGTLIVIGLICLYYTIRPIQAAMEERKEPAIHLDEIGKQISVIINGAEPNDYLFSLRKNGYWDLKEKENGKKYIVDKFGHYIYFNKEPLTYSLIKKLQNSENKYPEFVVTNTGRDGKFGTVDDIIMLYRKYPNSKSYNKYGIRLDLKDLTWNIY